MIRRYEENGEEWLDDHINGVTWHRPSDREEDNPLDENGHWKQGW
jgi:hypothetical protein